MLDEGLNDAGLLSFLCFPFVLCLFPNIICHTISCVAFCSWSRLAAVWCFQVVRALCDVESTLLSNTSIFRSVILLLYMNLLTYMLSPRGQLLRLDCGGV